MRENILEGLCNIGIKHNKEFGVHSLRSGGATVAANLEVKDKFIHENLSNKLIVTKSLGF